LRKFIEFKKDLFILIKITLFCWFIYLACNI